MKKILFFVAIATALFSCSSDDPATSGPDEQGEPREVKFEVSTFTETTKPLDSKSTLKAVGTKQSTTFTYVVYKKSTGAYVKHQEFVKPYAAKPTLELKDVLTADQYIICIAMQYVQDGECIAQPDLTGKKKYTDAVFRYSPASPCFFQTFEIDITKTGITQAAVLPRITGATEIYVTDIAKVSVANVTIGAYNIPQAFKVSTQVAVKTSPAVTSFEVTSPVSYFTTVSNYYKEDKRAYYPKNELLPFPASFTGGYKAGGICEGGYYPETYYRYIHSVPTTDIYFQISDGTTTKKVAGVKIEKNTLTVLSGEFNALKDNVINVSTDDTWNAEKIVQEY